MIALVLIIAAADPEALQLGPVSLVPGAQVKPRFEIVPDRTLAGGDPRIIVSHRVRVGAMASLELVDMLVEIQDVRAWGAEVVPAGLPTDPTQYGRVDGSLDLHQGWLGVHLGDVEARVGRQEISIGAERLIGAADFGPLARAFDAVRVLSSNDTIKWSAFGAIVSSTDAVVDLPDILVGAVDAELKLAPWARLSPVLVLDGNATAGKARSTFGTRFDGSSNGFGYDIDAYGQLSREPDGAIFTGAMMGMRGSYSFETTLHPKVGIVVDAISGSPNPIAQAGLAPFDTLFGTNHKFYGFADIFTNLPLHTRGHGLVDTAAFLWIHEGPWSATTAFHVFTPFAYPEAAMYGVEPDIVGAWKPNKYFSIEAGTALFIPIGDALGRGDQPAPWAYMTLLAQL